MIMHVTVFNLAEVQDLDEETYATMSVSAIILLVLQHCKNKGR